MGPEVDCGMQRLVLKPFRTSTTYANLKRTGQGVFHVTDDVELLAQAAVGTPDPLPPLIAADADRRLDPGRRVPLVRLADRAIDDSPERTRIETQVVARAGCEIFLASIGPSTPCWKRPSWPPARACCRPTKSLLNLNVCGRWSTRPAGESEHRAWAFLDRVIRQRCR